MTKTYNQIISVFADLASKHKQLNSFGSLQTWNWQAQKNVYPAALLVPVNSTIQQGIVTFRFDFHVMDLLNADKSNLNEVHSDTIQIINDFIAELCENQDVYGLVIDEASVSAVPFEETLDDVVAGWVATLDIKIQNSLDDCEAPFTM